ncbi:spore germination protein (amino acid permease) [Paenibacillus endophyticus]|uniref:Spore germination protein (Amino acid permease) n=1 Tax=Paenibacillus endophyticus TaxID=1294268 RepID=A0A7W5GBR8_9BACL|nr:endospore germination permease [Paenibacillus endophyticus]MBB3153698.1 spore germination protein (amino acid permease) [Paenibacillus endophyticus]
MAAQNKITHGQLSCLVFSYLSGFSTLFLSEAALLKQDVWMSYLIGMTLAIGMLWLLCYVQWKHPLLTMVEISDKLFGHWVSRLVLMIYLIYMLEMQAAACRALSTFYTTVVIPNMPSNQMILLIILCTTYATYLGLTTIVRAVQITLPFFLVGILIICFFLLRDVETNPFLPQFQHSFSEVMYGSLLSLYFPFGKLVVFGFLLARVKNMKKIFSSSIFGLILAALYLLVSAYLTLGTIGIHLAGTATFPFFSSIQMVKFGEYLERIEITIIGIWTIFTLFEIVVLQYVFTILLRHVFRIKNMKPFILPIGLLFFISAQKSFLRLSDLTFYNLNIAPFSTMLPIAIIPIMLSIMTLLRKEKT